MRNRILYVGLVGLVAAASLLVCAVGYAQEGPPAGGERGARDRGNRGDRPDFRNMTAEQREEWMKQMRQRMNDRIREQLGFTEEEWKAVEPLYNKVVELQRAGGPGMGGPGGRMMGRRGAREGGRAGNREGGQDRPAREQSELAKTRDALRTTLENKDSTDAQVAKALADYRAAKAKNAAELATARKALKDVLTPRQEAQCVSMGVLE